MLLTSFDWGKLTTVTVSASEKFIITACTCPILSLVAHSMDHFSSVVEHSQVLFKIITFVHEDFHNVLLVAHKLADLVNLFSNFLK